MRRHMTSRRLVTSACSIRNRITPRCQASSLPYPRTSKQDFPASSKTNLSHLALASGCGVLCDHTTFGTDLDVLNFHANKSVNAYLRFLGHDQVVAGHDFPAVSYPSHSLTFVDNEGVNDVIGSSRRRELQQQQALKEITRTLQTGHIIDAVKNPVSSFGHESYSVVLQDFRTRRKIRALFKPSEEGNGNGWHRAPIEWVAYKLNLMLGLDLVPPVVIRKEVDVDFTHFTEGVFMYFVNNAQELKETPSASWGMDKTVLLSDTRILDVLLQNSDRHHGNFLFGEHWSQGTWHDGKWIGKVMPVLIDHAAGFRAEADVRMTHENAFQTGPVKCVSARTYMRLRFMDLNELQQMFSLVLTPEEISDLLKRRIGILKYLEDLVEEQGFENTILDACT